MPPTAGKSKPTASKPKSKPKPKPVPVPKKPPTRAEAAKEMQMAAKTLMKLSRQLVS